MILDEVARELEASGVGSRDLFAILTEISASIDELDDGDQRPTLMKIVVGFIAAIEHIDWSADENRQMFYVLGETLSIAERGDQRNHALWMIDEGEFDSFDEAIRGHVDETGLYPYEIHDARLREVLPSIIARLPIDAGTDMFIGVPFMTPRIMGKAKDWL